MSNDLISNEELLTRLKAHNYSAPPITHSTRGVLIKKLAQLDAEKRQRGRHKGKFDILSFTQCYWRLGFTIVFVNYKLVKALDYLAGPVILEDLKQIFLT
jgi:hypothetical protein